MKRFCRSSSHTETHPSCLKLRWSFSKKSRRAEVQLPWFFLTCKSYENLSFTRHRDRVVLQPIKRLKEVILQLCQVFNRCKLFFSQYIFEVFLVSSTKYFVGRRLLKKDILRIRFWVNPKGKYQCLVDGITKWNLRKIGRLGQKKREKEWNAREFVQPFISFLSV